MIDLLIAAIIIYFISALFNYHFVLSILKNKSGGKLSSFFYSALNASGLTILIFIVLHIENIYLEIVAVVGLITFLTGVYLIYKYVLQENQLTKKTIKIHPFIDLLIVISLAVYLMLLI